MNYKALPFLIVLPYLCYADSRTVLRGSNSRQNGNHYVGIEPKVDRHRALVENKMRFSMRRIKGDVLLDDDTYGDPNERDEEVDWKGDDDDDDYDEGREENDGSSTSTFPRSKGEKSRSGKQSQYSKHTYSGLDSRDKSNKHHDGKGKNRHKKKIEKHESPRHERDDNYDDDDDEDNNDDYNTEKGEKVSSDHDDEYTNDRPIGDDDDESNKDGDDDDDYEESYNHRSDDDDDDDGDDDDYTNSASKNHDDQYGSDGENASEEEKYPSDEGDDDDDDGDDDDDDDDDDGDDDDDDGGTKVDDYIVDDNINRSPILSPVASNPSLTPTASPIKKSPTTFPSMNGISSELPSFDPSSVPSDIPSTLPSFSIEKTIRSIILTVALKGGAEFEDPNSYQSLALKFLENVLSPQSDEKYIQYYAIACIYTASFGVSNKYTNLEFPNTKLDGWIQADGWMTDSSFCKWYGISCENNAVNKIELFENRMYGIFPPEVQLIAESVTVIDLYDNPFLSAEGDEGNSWIAQMVNLEQLYFGSTAFEYDGIPTFFNNIPTLKELDISNTLYTSGPIRSEAFQGLNSLEYLDIAENTYTSSIPLELSNLPKLEFLYMDNISFQGMQLTLDFMLPMKEIRELWMDGTKIEGGIPTEIGKLLTLASFSAANCSLTGGIPSEMGNLIFLDRLWLDQNSLTGRIPQEFGNLGRLSIFHVEGNQLSGSMPSEVCDIGAENEVEIGADCAAESNKTLLECSCCTCCGVEACGDLN